MQPRWRTPSIVDGALLDVNLHGELVYPAAEILAAREIPFILLTGYGMESIAPEFARRPFIEKPFGLRQLPISWPRPSPSTTSPPARYELQAKAIPAG